MSNLKKKNESLNIHSVPRIKHTRLGCKTNELIPYAQNNHCLFWDPHKVRNTCIV